MSRDLDDTWPGNENNESDREGEAENFVSA